MANVLVDAYLCRNLGDDLMLTELCERRPRDSFFAPDLRAETAVPFKRLANLSATRRSGWFQAYWRWDAYVMCGGSMFIDRREISPRARSKFVARWIRRCLVVLIMRVLGRPVEVIGCNIGPIETRVGRALFRSFLRLATRVTVRDTESKRLAESWGVAVTQAPDMVLSLLARWFVGSRAVDAGKVVTVSVMEWPGLGVESSVAEYVALVRTLLERPDIQRVQLVGFQDVAIRDDLVVQQILDAEVWDERVIDGSYRGDLLETLGLVANSTHIVATRFHSAILAQGLGIPMVQIAYSKKISNYLESVGWSGSQWDTAPGLLRNSSPELVSQLMSAVPWVHRPKEAARHVHS